MGISGLLQFLKGGILKKHISDFRGKRVAVDALSWLHIGLFSQHPEILQSEFSAFSYLVYAIRMLKLLQHFEISPVFVFDGKSLSNKNETLEKRQNTREKNQHIAQKMILEGHYEAAQQYFVRSQAVTREMVHAFIDLVRAAHCQVIVAPGEADPQLVYLLQTGAVDFVISEDSDVIAFGGTYVIFKLKTNGNCHFFDFSRLKSGLGADYSLMGRFSRFKIALMCVLSGCDYVPSLKGIGPKTALELVWKCDSLKKLWKALAYMPKFKTKVTEEYKQKVEEAVRSFLYYPVYDERSNRICALSSEETEVTPQEPIALPVSDLRKYANGLVDAYTYADRTEFTDSEVLLKMYRKFKIPKHQQSNISFEFKSPSLKRPRAALTADPEASPSPVSISSFPQSEKRVKLTPSASDFSPSDVYGILMQRLARMYDGADSSEEENFQSAVDTPHYYPEEEKVAFDNPFKAAPRVSPKFEIVPQVRPTTPNQQVQKRRKSGQLTLEETFSTPK